MASGWTAEKYFRRNCEIDIFNAMAQEFEIQCITLSVSEEDELIIPENDLIAAGTYHKNEIAPILKHLEAAGWELVATTGRYLECRKVGDVWYFRRAVKASPAE